MFDTNSQWNGVMLSSQIVLIFELRAKTYSHLPLIQVQPNYNVREHGLSDISTKYRQFSFSLFFS